MARAPRWTFHFTPTSASWLNAVEGFFATLTKRTLKRGVFRSVADLQAAINRFLEEHNQQSQPFTWTADPDKRLFNEAVRGNRDDGRRARGKLTSRFVLPTQAMPLDAWGNYLTGVRATARHTKLTPKCRPIRITDAIRDDVVAVQEARLALSTSWAAKLFGSPTCVAGA